MATVKKRKEKRPYMKVMSIFKRRLTTRLLPLPICRETRFRGLLPADWALGAQKNRRPLPLKR